MTRITDIAVTSLAPMVWGSTYYITTEFLPAGYPLTVAMLRALPAGLLLLLLVRTLPTGTWWLKILILGGLNFSIFWWMLFESAYRLPGGVAATVGAVQPLVVIFLARLLLGAAIRPFAVAGAIMGVLGIALLVLTPTMSLDLVGLVAGLIGAASMALGTVLSRRWQPPVSLLTFTCWQLVAGGMLLLPAALWFEPALPTLTQTNILGFTYLGLIGALLTYVIWFRGLSRLDPSSVSALGFLSPVTAMLIGWILLGQSLSPLQIVAVVIVFISVLLSQFSNHKPVQSTMPSNHRIKNH